MTDKQKTDSNIYRDYIIAQADKTGVTGILEKYGISRGNLYDVVRRVKHGNPARIKKAMEAARLEILWTHKYKARFLSLPKDRAAGTVKELRSLIVEMDADKFPQMLIAAKLGKDRSTIIHHLGI